MSSCIILNEQVIIGKVQRPLFDEFIIETSEDEDKVFIKHLLSEDNLRLAFRYVCQEYHTSGILQIVGTKYVDDKLILDLRLFPDYEWNRCHESFRYLGGYYHLWED